MRPTFKSEGNQSAISSVNTVPTESENKIKQLTEADSNLVDENRQIDFQIEDILQMVKTMKESNVFPQDIVEKYGKANSGSIDNRVKGSQLVLLSYKLTGRKGVVNMHLRSTGGGMELSTVSAAFFHYFVMLGGQLRNRLMITELLFLKISKKEWKSSKP